MELPSFDEMMRLAAEDPASLESIRAQAIESFIGNAPLDLQRRLRGLQFRIDATRTCSSNPMAACLKISQMMHDQLHHLLDTINGNESPAKPVDHHADADSKIIPFPLLATI
ncbi:DUF3135 domain-containing protein [Thalassolituus marinus]|uniref:DUF3135 domain-containing protein n=1 Tax=Thalassolituus marinus TaxID=671053 RepID=A0ABS7ZXY6_9GAMM|nr:DUF3135 domain-containing protein [Thalassolituus marinus]MCA6065311.1 DUF3135 domain-containing protein [Thalassolituus marinus]